MGLLRSDAGERLVLMANTLVGRAATCNLRLAGPLVSGQHAQLRWIGAGWELHDLGSKNGTFVDSQRLPSGGRAALKSGQRLAFGQMDEPWTLVDDSPPSAMALPLSGGEALGAVGGVIGLPDPDSPELIIVEESPGCWVVEEEAGPRPLHDLDVVQVRGDKWRFHCGEAVDETVDAGTVPAVQNIQLSFLVSRDEEHVEVSGKFGHREIDLGSRAHHYTLLTLARLRLRDQKDPELPIDSHGWVHQEDLLRMLRFDPQRLSMDVFRARRQFGAAGIADAQRIVERRRDSSQLRLGVGHLLIHSS